jgi:four helix bundle protein
MSIKRFEDIKAWQMARVLTNDIYELTRLERFLRDFGLRDQITRAAGSVMNNIAEGFDAGSDVEFIRFLRYARRSCTEVQSELYIAVDQNYMDQGQFLNLYEKVGAVRATIQGFINYLEKSKSGPKSGV